MTFPRFVYLKKFLCFHDVTETRNKNKDPMKKINYLIEIIITKS